MRKLFLIPVVVLIFACGNPSKKKIDELTKKRIEWQDKKKAYVDSANALPYTFEQRDSFNTIYNNRSNPLLASEGKVPNDLFNYWQKIDDCDANIQSYDEQIITLSREADKK